MKQRNNKKNVMILYEPKQQLCSIELDNITCRLNTESGYYFTKYFAPKLHFEYYYVLYIINLGK